MGGVFKMKKLLKLIVFIAIIAGAALLYYKYQHIVVSYINPPNEIKETQQNITNRAVFVIGLDKYFVNNDQLNTIKSVHLKSIKPEPFIESDRAFISIAYLGDALSVAKENIIWTNQDRIITFKQPGMPEVELTIGEKEILINGQPKVIDTAPIFRQNEPSQEWDKWIHLPVRPVAEALDYQVDWDGEYKIVLCYPKEAEKPDISDIIVYLTNLETGIGNQEKSSS